MSSFFGRIKNKLSQDFGGRYLGIILEQVIRDAPSFAAVVFPGLPKHVIGKLKNGLAEVSSEVEFNGADGNIRRADLAICEGQSILALAEIKYEDHLSPSNYHQINDYIYYVTNNPATLFTYLTQYSPPASDAELIDRCGINRVTHLYFRDIYRSGKIYSETTVKWLIEFLEEEHVVYQDSLGTNALSLLKLLMIRGLNLKHVNGEGRLKTRSNISGSVELLQALLGNTIALSDWFYEELRSHFGNRFTPEFGFEASVKAEPLRKLLAQASDPALQIPPKHKEGGELWVTGQARIRTATANDWLYLTTGYSFEMTLHTGLPPTGSIIAVIHGNGFRAQDWKSFKLSDELALDEIKARGILAQVVRDTIQQASDDGLPSYAERPLSEFHRDVDGLLNRMKRQRATTVAKRSKRSLSADL